MLAIAANKDDMYENEEVDENEAKNLASELNAIFQKTSAKNIFQCSCSPALIQKVQQKCSTASLQA